METTGIEKLCASLTIEEANAHVARVGGKLKEAGDRKIALSLVSKIIMNKQGTIKKIWRTQQSVDVEVVRDNIFVFQFRNQQDRKRVLAGGPWCFNGGLLVLEEPLDASNITRMRFNKDEFWIQIHNIPIFCMNREVDSFLGAQLGELCEIDLGATGDCLGKYLRVRVRIDISKALRRGLHLDMGSGEKIFLLLCYKKLLNHCFYCGKLGHLFRECTEEIPRKCGTEFRYGGWLRASSPQKTQFQRMDRSNQAPASIFPQRGQTGLPIILHADQGSQVEHTALEDSTVGAEQKDATFGAPNMIGEPSDKGRVDKGKQVCDGSNFIRPPVKAKDYT
ncbi:hypothetical protein ACOSQ3_010897 [Xanthoceras sorbifolium]